MLNITQMFQEVYFMVTFMKGKGLSGLFCILILFFRRMQQGTDLRDFVFEPQENKRTS